MTNFTGNIEQLTLNNNFFRQVLFTGKHSQLVLMCLQQNEEIGMEVHEDVDQFFRLEEGSAKFVLDDKEFIANNGDAVVVSAGTNHNIINTGPSVLKLYTIYSPPNHPEGTVHKTKAEADAAE